MPGGEIETGESVAHMPVTETERTERCIDCIASADALFEIRRSDF